MANELQTKLDAIKLDKNTNLLPENLKAGVTCLGVEGNIHTPNIPEFTIQETVDCNLSNNLIEIELNSESDFDFGNLQYIANIEMYDSVAETWIQVNMNSGKVTSIDSDTTLKGSASLYMYLWDKSYYNNSFRGKIKFLYDNGYVEKEFNVNIIIPTEITVTAQIFDQNGQALKILNKSNFVLTNLDTQETSSDFEYMENYYTDTIMFKANSGNWKVSVEYDNDTYDVCTVNAETELTNYNFSPTYQYNLPFLALTTNVHTIFYEDGNENAIPYSTGCAEIEWFDSNDSSIGTSFAYDPNNIRVTKKNAAKAVITIKGYDISDTIVTVTDSSWLGVTVSRILESEDYWYLNARVMIYVEKGSTIIKNYDKDDVTFSFEFQNETPDYTQQQYGCNMSFKVSKAYTGELTVISHIEGYTDTSITFVMNQELGTATNQDIAMIMNEIEETN